MLPRNRRQGRSRISSKVRTGLVGTWRGNNETDYPGDCRANKKRFHPGRASSRGHSPRSPFPGCTPRLSIRNSIVRKWNRDRPIPPSCRPAWKEVLRTQRNCPWKRLRVMCNRERFRKGVMIRFLSSTPTGSHKFSVVAPPWGALGGRCFFRGFACSLTPGYPVGPRWGRYFDNTMR